MGYYDGNTVSGIWNYAQQYALNDNSFSTTFGPSTPGAINLVSGQTNGVINTVNPGSAVVADGNGGLTLISDADPTGDTCSSTTQSVSMSGKNIGDLLNAKNVTWGWFQGGFDLGMTNTNGTTSCKRSTLSSTLLAATVSAPADYVPHHEPFQYYAGTQNLTHARPTMVSNIGQTDAANHQYDTHDFTDALAAGVMPSVSFIKAPKYQNGHAATLHEYKSDMGQSMAMLLNRRHWHEPTTEKPKLNSTEIWEFMNLTEDTHPMHIHLVRFQVLDRRPFDTGQYILYRRRRFTAEAQAAPPHEMGWKDVVQCPPGMVTRVIMRFEGYTGKYLYHCHILEHEANDMMRPFEVIS